LALYTSEVAKESFLLSLGGMSRLIHRLHGAGMSSASKAVLRDRPPEIREHLAGLAPEEQPDGHEESSLVVSSGDLATVRDQTPHVETSAADSVDSTVPPVVRALAQLSGTLIMLANAGEVGHARVVHDAIGKLLAPLEGSHTAERGAEVIALGSAHSRVRCMGESAGPM
jgi:hypothetical protein